MELELLGNAGGSGGGGSGNGLVILVV
jgi:hypothetical protein